jgi:hypothetical protein
VTAIPDEWLSMTEPGLLPAPAFSPPLKGVEPIFPQCIRVYRFDPFLFLHIKQWVIVILVVLTRVFGAYCAKWRNSGSKTGPVAEFSAKRAIIRLFWATVLPLSHCRTRTNCYSLLTVTRTASYSVEKWIKVGGKGRPAHISRQKSGIGGNPESRVSRGHQSQS